MSSYVPCAVPGCEDRKSSRHRFPNPEKDKDRFQRWITAVANSKLVNLGSKQIYNNYRVCHQHFTEKDTSTNMYLKRIAVSSQKLSIISVPSAKDEVYLEKPTSPNSESQLTETETSVQPEEVAVTHSETAQKVPEEGSAALPRTPPPSTSRETLLKSVNVSRSIELSPKARCLYQKARKLQNVCAAYKKRTRSLKQRMQAARTNAHLFDYTQSSLRTEAVNFCIQQLRRKVTKRRGQRFSLEEKLMSLALYKTAGAGYRFMSKWFNLPSKRTLTRLLQNIPVDEGINQFVMQNLKASCQHLKSRERLCLLLFDDVALMPSLTYNKHKDTLVGIKNGELADHALVFMVRGITRKWKQTLLYNFSKGTTKSSTIKSLVISLIRELKKAGLVVIATVCDQGSTNRSAIESIIADSRAQYLKNDKIPKRRIIVDESEVIPLYDVPHLVKGLRNNLLEKDLIWQKQDTVYVAKWEDIVNAYYIDSSEDIRCIPKITECHVIKGKLKKMKVSCATQVFSHSMAAAISIMARNEESDITGEHKMDKRARETAQVIKFLDTVFDSLNGGTYTGHPGKPLKGAVRKNSEHVSFWREAICSMKNMYFRKEGTQQNIIPPSLKNFIITLEGFIDLTEVLLKKVPYFLTRSVNQDPLENYFGQIRQHRGRHTNPSCAQFEDSYRALLIRSISGTHSAAANCEETFETSLFQLQDIVSRGRALESEPYVFEDNPCIYRAISTISDVKLVRPLCKSVLGYISGFIAKKVLMKFKCDFCRIHIVKTSPTNSDFSELISAKEYNRSRNMLMYCNDVFVECIYKAYNIAKIIVSNYNIDRNIKKNVCTYIKQFVHFSFVCNHKDELINYIINFVTELRIFTFCKCVNNILSGKNSNVTNKSCALYKQAQIIHQKRNKMKK